MADLFAVHPCEERVEPAYCATEPAVRADGLAAEVENKFTQRMAAERQSYVHEADVPPASGVGMVYRSPYCYGVNAFQMQLAASREIPHVTVPVRVDANASAHYAILFAGYEHIAMPLLMKLGEHVNVRNVTPDFKCCVPAEHTRQFTNVVFVCGKSGMQARLAGVVKMLDNHREQPFGGSLAVQ